MFPCSCLVCPRARNIENSHISVQPAGFVTTLVVQNSHVSVQPAGFVTTLVVQNSHVSVQPAGFVTTLVVQNSLVSVQPAGFVPSQYQQVKHSILHHIKCINNDIYMLIHSQICTIQFRTIAMDIQQRFYIILEETKPPKGLRQTMQYSQIPQPKFSSVRTNHASPTSKHL